MMITGDGEHTAKSVCEKIGIEKFHAKVLPEDKLNIIEKLKADDHKVVMVGDGINDSPALAAADVSVAMKDASDIAREVADITLLTSDLDKLVVLRILSERLFKRIYNNYRFIALFNSSLLLLGMVGVLSPSSSALLHNLSTMGICAKSMKLFLDEEEQ
jgi:P-type E1-E2 ATPase